MATHHDQHHRLPLEVPGEPTQTGTAIIEAATSAIQAFGLLNNIHKLLCAFPFCAHDMTRQLEAHQFCSHQSKEMRQCLICKGPGSDAHLIGIEYVVSEDLFLTLLEVEKPMWLSHKFEVKGRNLFMPDIPGPIKCMDLEKVSKKYRKTIQFWQVNRGHWGGESVSFGQFSPRVLQM